MTREIKFRYFEYDKSDPRVVDRMYYSDDWPTCRHLFWKNYHKSNTLFFILWDVLW